MNAPDSPPAATQRGPTNLGRAELLLRRLFLTSLVLLTGLVSTSAALTVREAFKQPAAWFASAEGSQFIGNVVSHQSPVGSWPKNENTGASAYSGDPAKLKGTFDNGATTGELRLLAKASQATGNATYSNAVVRGIDHILGAQYTNGGWPQFSPPPAKTYHRHITFNDDAMRRLLEFLREVAGPQEAASNLFAFIDPPRRAKAAAAFAKGIDCILKCQVRVDGKLTVWCAQHDEITLEPRPARAFELTSLSGAESAGLLIFLMRFEQPSPEVVKAVHAGAAWFETSKLTGIREVKVDGDKKIVRDPAAPSLWARFYEIDTNRPFYCGRDGIKRFDISEIEAERRNGYAWHGAWGSELTKRYADWKSHWPAPSPNP